MAKIDGKGEKGSGKEAENRREYSSEREGAGGIERRKAGRLITLFISGVGATTRDYVRNCRHQHAQPFQDSAESLLDLHVA